ncbi:MAG: FGGY-family carbohydrate kinase [Rhodoglobus sp.]
MTRLFLGIDIGTFETKGVLVDQHGVVRARASRRHGISTPRENFVEQDADDIWWADVCVISRELMASEVVAGATIEAMACSAIGPCVLPVDENLRPLRPGILYGIDARSAAQIEQLNDRLGKEQIFARSGNALTSQSAGPKIAWIVENEPDVAARTRWYLTSQSYLVARLTGRVTIDHGTAGYFHPLYDLAEQRWNVEGCEDFVTEQQLPEILWATEIAGEITAEAAAETGLPVGMKVTVGTTDSPAEAVGAAVVDAGDLMIQYGSAGYMINVLDEPQTDPSLWSAPFVFPGSFVLAAGTATAGTVTRWIADILHLDAEHGDDELFGQLVALAEGSPVGANGVLMLPHLSGERTPVHDPQSRGILFGLSLAHSRADVARAALEGVAHSIAHAFSAYARAGFSTTAVTAIGGGTKNHILLESVSAITGETQTVTDSYGASFGDAALAALAVGVIGSRSDIKKWVTSVRTVEPNEAAAVQLRSDHSDYRELYAATANLAHSRAGGNRA